MAARRNGRPSFGEQGDGGNSRPPFVLESRSRDAGPDGRFTPEARVSLSPDFGTSGLLRAVSADDLATLLLVLSKVTSNGGFVATPEALAPMLGVPRGAMVRRLERLASVPWRGAPLATRLKTESGLLLFAPSYLLFETQSNGVFPVPPGGQARDALPSGVQSLPPSRRDENVARSRELYARPRAEVESEIERFLRGEAPNDGQGAGAGDAPLPRQAAIGRGDGPEPSEERQTEGGRRWLALKKRLLAAGLSNAQAKFILDAYPFEGIERQLEWLPHRVARNPVAYLLAAVAGDYAPPRSLPAAPAKPENADG